MRLYHWLAIGTAIFAAFKIGTCNKKPAILEPITENPYIPEIKKKDAYILILEDSLRSVKNRPHDTVYKILTRTAHSVLFLPAGPSIHKWDSLNRQQFPLDK